MTGNQQMKYAMSSNSSSMGAAGMAGGTGAGPGAKVELVESLRKAIENLIDAKLHDALSRPGGLDRLVAHRTTGVASYDIRNAERRLEQTLAEILVAEGGGKGKVS